MLATPLHSPNLAPHKFQERSSGASRMQENLLAVGTPPGPRWGAYLQRPPALLAGGEGTGCPLQWRRQDFVTGGDVRYGSMKSPPVPVVLSVYQRGSLLDGLAMYLSCDTKKFHDNESTHILHNFWTSTHMGEAFPSSPPGGATGPLPKNPNAGRRS